MYDFNVKAICILQIQLAVMNLPYVASFEIILYQK